MLRRNINAVAIGIAAGSLAGFLISGAVSGIVAARILNLKENI
jgi:hypothetical protein